MRLSSGIPTVSLRNLRASDSSSVSKVLLSTAEFIGYCFLPKLLAWILLSRDAFDLCSFLEVRKFSYDLVLLSIKSLQAYTRHTMWYSALHYAHTTDYFCCFAAFLDRLCFTSEVSNPGALDTNGLEVLKLNVLPPCLGQGMCLGVLALRAPNDVAAVSSVGARASSQHFWSRAKKSCLRRLWLSF